MTERNYDLLSAHGVFGFGVPVKAWTRGVVVEDKAKEQLLNVSRMPFVRPHVAVMPDVHWGLGCTVGSVVPTKGAIIPAAVGVDLGCVDCESEYLSPDGWRRIADYVGGPVMQYDEVRGVATFVQPDAFVKRPSSGFLRFRTKYGVDQLLSPDHRVICWRRVGRDRRRELVVVSAAEFATEHQRLKIGFRAEFLTTFDPKLETRLYLSDEELLVQVMLMADGSLDRRGNGSATLRLKKQRKIVRARDLLRAARIKFTEHLSSTDGCTTIRFRAPLQTKTYGDLWNASLHQLRVITGECLHWDGNTNDRVFYTRDRASADFIQYAFSATGKRAVLRADKRVDDVDYRVFAHDNVYVGLAGSPKSTIEHVPSQNGMEYCFRVPSGFWVMRRGGNIVVTGNCGMSAVRSSLRADHLPDNLVPLRAAIEKAVPHGRTDDGRAGDRGAWGMVPGEVHRAWDRLSDDPRYRSMLERHPKAHHHRPAYQLGTLGTGNHFIEVCIADDGAVWAMLHSGSRGPGNRIGQYFIEKAKREMERWFVSLPDRDLAYLAEGSEYFDAYLDAVGWAQDYALENRELMMAATLKAMREILGPFTVDGYAVDCHHNYVARENHFGENLFVTRKGAVRAREGDLGIIPGSMGARSFIVRGKGNPDSLHSCSHGAGRAMSRTEAKRRFTVDDHAKAVEGIECRKDADVVDETPGAYKPIADVMAAQADLVEVLHELRQVVCVKG